MIEARILLDSISPRDHRLTTFVVTFNRWILAEWNTHRALSRNAASSRAIPVKKMLAAVRENPAMPVHWGKAESGMQANAELDEVTTLACKDNWLVARDNAVSTVEQLMAWGLAKQVTNRLLEPWGHVTVLVSATDWDNFFALRAHADAQPEFRALAFKMLECYNASMPRPVDYGQWHIPFGDRMPEGLTHEQRLKVATARAARLSYLTFEGEIDLAKDYELHDRLLASGHMSPLEHCAQVPTSVSDNPRYGNFTGWQQYRQMIPGENRTDPRIVRRTFTEALKTHTPNS